MRRVAVAEDRLPELVCRSSVGEDYYSRAAASNAYHKNLYTVAGLLEYSQGFENR
jgi:hypothetical protein